MRRYGLILEEQIPRDRAASRIDSIVRSLSDPDPVVRFQARLTFSHVKSDRHVPNDDALLRHVLEDADSAWQRYAIRLWRGPDDCGLFMARLVATPRLVPAGKQDAAERLICELCEQAASSTDRFERELAGIGVSLLPSDPALGLLALQSACRGYARRKLTIRDVLPEKAKDLPARLAAIASDPSHEAARQQLAVELIGYVPDSVECIVPFLSRESDQGLRLAAVAALARQRGTQHWQDLLDGFAAETPPVRRAIVDGVLASADRTQLLLDAIEAGRIKPSELDISHVNRLTNHRDAAIKERAAKLLAAATPQDRAQALADYQPVLKIAGDAARGQAVFEKNCAACHKIGEVGVNVAPDISDSRTKTAAQLLTDILQPNRAIDNNYVGYAVRLADGTVQTGILTTETATSITLRLQGGKDLVISRSEIDELKSTGVSLMPEGLERQIPLEDMADLLTFIKHWRYLDGRTPLSPSGSATGK